MLTPAEQIEQLKHVFFQMGSVIELLAVVGDYTGPLDENQTSELLQT